MKKILIIIIIILSLILLKFSSTYIVNEVIINSYEDKEYDTNLINYLYFLNITEPYIVYYNHGNLLYQNKSYDLAITKYNEALLHNPPKDRVCNIRINLALSYLATIDEQNIEETLDILNSAKDVLLKDNCATIDDDGISPNAQQLKEDIEKKEQELQDKKEESNNNNNSNNEENNNNESKSVEEKLKEVEKQSQLERNDDLDSYREYDNNGFTYYDGKTW